MSDAQGWVQELPAAVTVTDADGTIVALNRRAGQTFAGDRGQSPPGDRGGAGLVGRSVFDCHPPRARARLEHMYTERQPNHYTIRKAGQRKIIHQLPWYKEGRFAGFVEISVPIPDELPHFERG